MKLTFLSSLIERSRTTYNSIPTILFCCFAIVTCYVDVVTAVPMMINYQGKVEVNGELFGSEIGQTGYFRFAMVDVESGTWTTLYWSNDNQDPPVEDIELTVKNGLYNVILGNTDMPGMTHEIPADVFTNDTVYLAVWFDDGITGVQLLEPYHRITSVGFAINAANSEKLEGICCSQLLRNDQDGSIAGNLIVNGCVGISKEITDAKLEILAENDQNAIKIMNSDGRRLILYRSEADHYWHFNTGDGFAFEEDSVIRLVIPESGKVGIGTTDPGAGLTVARGRLQVTTNDVPSNGAGLEMGYGSGVGAILSYDRDTSAYKQLKLNGLSLDFRTNDNRAMFITSSRNVGIGTGDPGTWKLYVRGKQYVYDFLSAAGGVHVGGTSDPGTDNLIVDGKIGVGIGSPSAKLHVNGTIRGGSTLQFSASNNSISINDPYFEFKEDGKWAGLRAQMVNFRNEAGTQAATIIALANGHLEFQHKINWSSFDWTYGGTKLMTLGTGDAHLCLHGTAQCEAGCDLAEKVISTDIAEPGDVLVIDPLVERRFMISCRPSSTLVAGVVSTKPGIVLNDETSVDIAYLGEQKVQMAIAGRVPCKVSLENGSIEIGDMLVTSSTPGHAMKSNTHLINNISIHIPGTILGKALEPFYGNNGKTTGIITILLALN